MRDQGYFMSNNSEFRIPNSELAYLRQKIRLFVMPPAEHSVQTPQSTAVNRPGHTVRVLEEM